MRRSRSRRLATAGLHCEAEEDHTEASSSKGSIVKPLATVERACYGKWKLYPSRRDNASQEPLAQLAELHANAKSEVMEIIPSKQLAEPISLTAILNREEVPEERHYRECTAFVAEVIRYLVRFICITPADKLTTGRYQEPVRLIGKGLLVFWTLTLKTPKPS